MGSNLGDSRRILEEAVARLESVLGPLAVAPTYLTEPVSAIPQPPYLNTVAVGVCDLTAPSLLDLTQRIEIEFGRDRAAGQAAEAPRTLDVDLLLLGDELRCVDAPLLPHPRMRARRFVLAPLCDVAPDWRLPPDGATACELLRQLPEKPWARRSARPRRSLSRAAVPLMTALALALQWVVLGLHVLVPWRLARIAAKAAPPTPATRDPADHRELWAMLAAPLLLAAVLAGVFTLNVRLDAALAWGLRWPPESVPALVLGFAGLAAGLADLILFAGFRKLEPAGWRIAAALGAFLLLAASVVGELLRIGRGPSASLAGLLLAILCRIPLALAAGEATSGPIKGFAALAGAALPLSLLGFPAPLRSALGVDLATLAAAAALLLVARFLPVSLRRPAALAGVLLAALFLDRTADLQVMLEPPSTIPDLLLPEP